MQIFIYGISLSLNGVVISLLIVFLSIENQSVNLDYLTGVYNRKRLKAYLNKKVALAAKNKPFSAIMLDMDNFKQINDTFGHDMGDNVLKITTELLKICVGPKEFIARYGGDEFCIVLDIANIDELNAMVLKIKNSIESFNNTSAIPCKLNFSMGCAVYDYNLQMSVEEFSKYIDTLMYDNKRIRHEFSLLHK